MGTTVPFTRLPASPGTPSSPSCPTWPWRNKRWELWVTSSLATSWTRTGEKKLLPAWRWGQSHQALWDPGDEHQGHYTELASEEQVPCPLLSQDEGSLMGLGGLSWGDLPAPHPQTSQGSPRAAEGSHRRALPLQRGQTGRRRANASGFSPQTTTGVDQFRLGHPMPSAWSPSGATHGGRFWRYLFSFATFPPFRTSFSWRPLKPQRRSKPLRKDVVPSRPPSPLWPQRAQEGGCSKPKSPLGTFAPLWS